MSHPVSILVVEDDVAMRMSCRQVLESAGHQVVEAGSARDAEPILVRQVFDLVITDLKMPHGGGKEVLAAVKRICPEVPVLVITAYPSVESAVEAFRGGVADYLLKPFTGDQLLDTVERTMSKRQAVERAAMLRQIGSGASDMPELVGVSPAFNEMLTHVRRMARLDGNVFVSGETGSGKELAARAIHHFSRRAAGPYTVLNCAAVPDTLFEAELFGYEKGSFTGANAAKRGLFEEANGGSLFLDEVADLSLAAQAKLLRAIEDGVVRRVGAVTGRQVDVRIITATHKDLAREVAAERFRADLFYRLAVLEVRVPPLRERPEDIVVLAIKFLDRFRGEGQVVGFSDEALDRLAEYPWPGNIRELQNVVQKACAYAEEPVIGVQDLALDEALKRSPTAAAAGTGAGAGLAKYGNAIAHFERDYVVEAIKRHDGNMSHTAKALGVHRTTLQRVLKRLSIGADELR